METVIIIVFGVACFTAGIYVTTQITEWIDSRIQHKKFLKNLDEFDSGRSKNDPVTTWNKHKREKKK